MAHHDEEHTNPGRIPQTGDFADDEDVSEGTEEVTQVDQLHDQVTSDNEQPVEVDDNPFDTLDGPTVVPG